MPETPSTIVIEDEAPVSAPPDVPIRKGEERHQAALNLENQRRRDSEIDEMREQIAKLTGGAAPQQKYSQSVSARQRQKALRAKADELKSLTRRQGDVWEGPCAPFTVVNFNPVRLSLQGQLQDQSVPPAGAGKRVTFPYKGRTFVASYVTFRNPKVWPVIIGTENLEGFDAPSIKADYIAPMGIAHQFFSHYVVGSIDAEGMGGIVIFEGDVHILEDDRQKRTHGHIRVPLIDPELSEPGRVAYKVEERLLSDCVRDALTVQRGYADAKIAEGHRFATSQSDEIRNQRSGIHTLWHNWALAMGYKEKAEPWASEILQDSPDIVAVFCQRCRTKQTDPKQHFCSECNAPFDAYKTFVEAHMTVPMEFLEMYEGKQWDAIVKESRSRAAKRALLEESDEPKRAKKPAEATT